MVIVYDKIMLVLCIVTLVLIVFGLFEFWLLSIIFMLMLIIILMVKVSSEKKIEKVDKDRGRLISLVTERLDSISGKVEDAKTNINRSVFVLENRIAEVKHSYETEMEDSYRELAKKIFDVENKLGAIKKTLGAAYGTLDERLHSLEEDKS